MPKGGKGVQHSKPMALPAKATGPSRGAGGKGVQHAKAMSLPGRKHSFAQANGGHQGTTKAAMRKDDAMRHTMGKPGGA